MIAPRCTPPSLCPLQTSPSPAFPPHPPPPPPALHLLSATFSFFFFFWNKKILIFQRDKGRIKEELAAAKQQLHLQTRGHYNEAAEALPRQHTGRWRGNMVTHWQRRQEGGGRVGGNKGRKREMEVVILGVFTCSFRRCLPGRARWSRRRSAVSVSQLMFIVGHLHHTGSIADGVFPFLLGSIATTGRESLAFVFCFFRNASMAQTMECCSGLVFWWLFQH